MRFGMQPKRPASDVLPTAYSGRSVGLGSYKLLFLGRMEFEFTYGRGTAAHHERSRASSGG